MPGQDCGLGDTDQRGSMGQLLSAASPSLPACKIECRHLSWRTEGCIQRGVWHTVSLINMGGCLPNFAHIKREACTGGQGQTIPLHAEEVSDICCQAISEGCCVGGWQLSMPLTPNHSFIFPAEAAIPGAVGEDAQ